MPSADLVILAGFAALGGYTFLRIMSAARDAAVSDHRQKATEARQQRAAESAAALNSPNDAIVETALQSAVAASTPATPALAAGANGQRTNGRSHL